MNSLFTSATSILSAVPMASKGCCRLFDILQNAELLWTRIRRSDTHTQAHVAIISTGISCPPQKTDECTKQMTVYSFIHEKMGRKFVKIKLNATMEHTNFSSENECGDEMMLGEHPKSS